MKESILEQNFLKEKNWALEYFLTDTTKLDLELHTIPEDVWQQRGEARALKLFHAASKHVPAYKKFLRKHRINPNQIQTISDFKQIPWTDKKNYIDAYPERERQWHNVGNTNTLIASSSGTTGIPHLWPRGGYQEYEAAILHELLYKKLFGVGKKSTLVVIGFPMGVYVSGIATLIPTWLSAQKGLPLTVVTTGNNKDLMLSTVKNSASAYDQVLLIGHPFFIKDVLEAGQEQHIPWKKISTKLMLCSEGFSEEWRSYIANIAGANVEHGDIISVYGSSELLLKAFETPLSIGFRKKISSNKQLAKKILGTPEIPNVFQYNPLLRYIETEKDELLFTAISGTPLVRFNLHDRGIVISHKKITLHTTAKKNSVWKLPFVAMWGRSDNTLILHAANIYPEHVHAALNHAPFFKKITGKFSMGKNYTKKMDEFMSIHIELRQGIKSSSKLKKTIRDSLIKKLKELNIEYRFLSNTLGNQLIPKVTLWPYHSEKYFKPGLKPKYIITA